MTATADFFIDPICPFCWITSRWAVEVADQIDLELRWKFIALKVINEEDGYANYPPGYEHSHMGGFRQLRVLARVRDEFDNESAGRLYAELGTRNHNLGLRKNFADEPLESVGNSVIEASLRAADLPVSLIEAASDASLDELLRGESAEALRRTGPDVGTPIITFSPDTESAMSFFGPVLSEIPRGQAAVDLWHLVEAIAKVPGFAELKRSLRDKPSFD